MAKIFISYRREDSQYAVDRLHIGLKPHVANPDRDIFIDVDNIPLGVDFIDHLDSKVGECEILLAVIGPDWLSTTNPATGERKIDDPKDFVRIEIAAALRRGIPVVPVLMDGAPVPTQNELPIDLKALATRNGTQINRLSFEADVVRLARGLGLAHDPDMTQGASSSTHIAADPAVSTSPANAGQSNPKPAKKGRKWPLFAGLGVGLIAVAGAGIIVLDNLPGSDSTWIEFGGITFGDNSGMFADDGACDDSRFSGEGRDGGITSDSHIMMDAADCLAEYQAGRLVFGREVTATEIVPALTPPEELFAGVTATIDFGDDAGNFANDNACDDARFSHTGDDYGYMREHVLHDATDCRAAYESGTISLVLDFGDDSGIYTFDSDCDDNRFTGPGRSVVTSDSQAKKDAFDCITAYQLGTISRNAN